MSARRLPTRPTPCAPPTFWPNVFPPFLPSPLSRLPALLLSPERLCPAIQRSRNQSRSQPRARLLLQFRLRTSRSRPRPRTRRWIPRPEVPRACRRRRPSRPPNLPPSLRPRTIPNNVALTYTSGEQVEVYRFGIPATILIPLTAVFLQAWLPLRLPFFSIFDLPLLVTISFAMARRSQVAGIFTAALIGIFQDALTGQPIGLYGIAKTVVGFGVSSLGVKLAVEHARPRVLLTLGFYVVHEIVYFTMRGLVSLHLEWSWQHELGSAVANAILGVFLYALLDRLKQST